jgi:UDP-N-acetylmuramoylalanine-D-glutamate ligase
MLSWMATADGASPWPQAHVVVAGIGVSGFAAADGLMEFGARVTVLDDSDSEANSDKGKLLEVLYPRAARRHRPGDHHRMEPRQPAAGRGGAAVRTDLE